jgi:putative transposase
MQSFEKAADYQAFEQVLRDTLDQSPMRICAYAVMPNHWHLLLWPECDGELAAFMQRLTITHVRRWQEHRGYAGLGHVYQGRYKSFPVESDEHFWVVARYVERNALRANLVLRAEEWRWSSLWQRCHPTGEERSLLAAWPIDMPANWLERVNQTDDAQELEALRRSVQRGRPFGQPEWQKEIAQRLRGGKRDRYDIDKMGSFGLWFGDATNSAGRSWWNGFSRFKSRRGANAVVRESGRLPSIRAGFAGYS